MVTIIIATITVITTPITPTIIIAITTGTTGTSVGFRRCIAVAKKIPARKEIAIPVRGWPRSNAKQCRALAALVTRPEDKVTLEEIAKAWEKVAAFRARDLYEAIAREWSHNDTERI